MRTLCTIAAGLGLSCMSIASADILTGPSGGGLPQTTVQPSLAINYIVRTEGVFENLGDIGMFAGNFAPGGWMPADGRLLPIAQHTALFAMLGTTYGGNGQTTFALPDLRGRVPIGQGTGAGLTPRTLGEVTGVEAVTLTPANLPAHSHALPWGSATDNTGGNQPYTNIQPSLTLNYAVPLEGIYPARESSFFAPMLGHVSLTARSWLPDGWATASGQLLPISQNTAVFSLLGTTYGGNGQTTYALPDLRGRAVVGAGQGPGLPNWSLGETAGVEQAALAVNQLPAHVHALPSLSDITGPTGGGQGQTNLQPSLALNYIIATEGIFPSRDGFTDDGPFLGQISLFAGNFSPRGWAFAQGQLLSIAQNTALFSLLGTTFGGDGRVTFALPDLRGRVAVGAGEGPGLTPWDLGQTDGTNVLFLTEPQMAAHAHAFVPEPSACILLALGGTVLASRRRR